MEELDPKRQKSVLYLLAGILIIMGLASYAAANYSPPVPLTNVVNNPLLLGVVNARGEWILPPAYDEIVYLKKAEAFWLKEKNPSMAKYLWPPNFLNSIGKSKNWKLVDKNGKDLGAQLPEGQEPLREYPPSQAYGVSFYNDSIAANSKDGASLNDSKGRPLTPSNLHSITYAGEGVWIAQPGRDEEATTEEKVFPNIHLGDPFHLPPAVVLLDEQGKRIVKLPKGVVPRGFFKNDLLVCDVMGSLPCAVHKSGRLAYSPGAVLPGLLGEKTNRPDEPRSFNAFYNWPISADKPVKFIDISKKGNYPSEIVPVAVAENVALVSTQNDMYGLVNRKGEWLVPPDYNRLAYCGPDRLIVSKGSVDSAQRKQRELDFGRPDIR